MNTTRTSLRLTCLIRVKISAIETYKDSTITQPSRFRIQKRFRLCSVALGLLCCVITAAAAAAAAATTTAADSYCYSC